MTVDAREISDRFVFGAAMRELERHGAGLINETFLVTFGTPPRRAILQRINTRVFTQPSHIMSNLRVLSDHVRVQKSSLRLPEIIPARGGADYVRDDIGNFWRALTFIEHSRVLERIENTEQAQALGAALGQFHALTHSLPIEELHETLPGFHVTPQYFEQLTIAEQKSKARDGAEVQLALEFAHARAAGSTVLEDAKNAGRLSVRVTHGDPKLNNVLFDDRSDSAVSLIDLDTVQAGLIHYDVGDCLRSSCNVHGEAPKDLADARFDVDLAREILRGYCAAARDTLTPSDYEFLYDAIRLLPLELGVRFLTDHLSGDVYFRVKKRGVNLHRARVQFRLVASIEEQEAELRRIIADCAAR